MMPGETDFGMWLKQKVDLQAEVREFLSIHMTEYIVNALSICCINGRLVDPNSIVGQDSAFSSFIGNVDSLMTDFLHN